jgi:hypothetical protein
MTRKPELITVIEGSVDIHTPSTTDDESEAGRNDVPPSTQTPVISGAPSKASGMQIMGVDFSPEDLKTSEGMARIRALMTQASLGPSNTPSSTARASTSSTAGAIADARARHRPWLAKAKESQGKLREKHRLMLARAREEQESIEEQVASGDRAGSGYTVQPYSKYVDENGVFWDVGGNVCGPYATQPKAGGGSEGSIE